MHTSYELPQSRRLVVWIHAIVMRLLPLSIYPDLSENEVGALAAKELREYMRNKGCKLRSLAIRKADIDDDECR